MTRELCEGYDAYRQPFFDFISRLLVNKFMPKRALDIGCGGGGLVIAFQNLGVETFGIDASEKALRDCVKGVEERLILIDLDRQILPFKDGSFELITCCEVLEHLERPEDLLIEIKRVLVKGGIAYISTPTPPFFGEKFYILAGIRPDSSHINTYSKSFWIDKFNKAGFKLMSELRNEMAEFRLHCPSRKVGALTALASRFGIPRKTLGNLRSNFSGHFLFERL